MAGFFEGFRTVDIDVDDVRIHARVGGSGPPLLLLHGYPQTHVMWHRVAPELAREHTVVVADLRGYGDSSKPAGGADHAAYSKRAMAADQVGLMRALGFESFAAAGHDRGARVLHRMCLDHPPAVTRAALLDIVPTRYLFTHVDRALATAYYHWFFLTQPNGLPERLIGAQPEWFLRHTLTQWSASPDAFDPSAVEEYVRCFASVGAVAASCEDYRAGASIDLEHDAASPGPVTCPLLVVWGSRGFVGSHYDVPAVWREHATDVRAESVDGGHFVCEEAPVDTARLLADFLR